MNKVNDHIGAYGKLMERSKGKDTVTGHWEIGGVILDTPLNTYPNGFSKEIIDEFLKRVNKKGVLGNCVASGTEIIERLGDEHVKTGYPIVYTSADSVFQIAAHEDVIPLDELYNMCSIAREMLVDENVVGRVIARPFIGKNGEYKRTSNRRDYALDPFSKTMLEYLYEDGKEVAAVDATLKYMDEVKEGLIFTNLVDFDMLYGYRNDPKGYGKAIEDFDNRLQEIYSKLGKDDILMLTADHGCDPTTESTDHSREYIPILVYGENIKPINIGTRKSFTDISKTILEYFNIDNNIDGESFLKNILG